MSLGAYVIQRILLAVLTVWLVTLIVFTLLRVVVPVVYGDAVDVIAREYGGADPALADQLRDEYGLTGSLPGQYLRWVSGILEGDLGESLFNGRSVTQEMGDRLPVSVELGLVGLLSGLLLAVPTGIICAVAQDRWPDYVFRTLAVLVSAVPGFWVAIMAITLASRWWNWAPPLDFYYLWENPIAHAKMLLLPAVLIGLTPSAGLVRLTRTQMLEVLRQDYIRTAHAKGLSQTRVVYGHALRNALIPVVTVIGLTLPSLIAGTAIFESIFTLPGMGQYLVSSVSNLDYPVIQSTNLVFAIIIVVANLVVDLSYTILDPRIRY